VTRTPNETDGRGVYVDLTDAGRELIDHALPDHVATEHRMLEGLTAAQREHLVEALRVMLGTLEDEEG
jgi:DNA-binding MarR family transcriptional regulator